MTLDLHCEGLTRNYGKLVALDGFEHRFARGKVHALMGKNGSGKSTLVKMLNGAVQPSAGRILLDGTPVRFDSPGDAFRAGIVTVHQELSMVRELTVAENIFLGRLPRKRRMGISMVDWHAVQARSATLLEDMGIDIDPSAPVHRLSVGQSQVVEIAKAMSFEPRILLLDEPTSALASNEVDVLFRLLRALRAKGVTMLYISHRMSELFEIADEAVVLRDGVKTGAVPVPETTTAQIVEMMFGETARAASQRRARPVRGKPVLEVEGLTRLPVYADISFTLHEGEVLGIAGLMGAGRTELLRGIFGAEPPDKGLIRVFGEEVSDPSPRRMKLLGIGYTPENRKEDGLVLDHSIHANLSMASLDRLGRGGFITREMERPGVARQIAELGIKVGSADNPAGSLSGGNQQKVVIGNWMHTNPRVMFFDEPSRGVDVNAKQQVFEIIRAKAAEGLAVVFVSSELEELLEVCDRILVLREGRLTAERDPTSTTLQDLYGACMGEAA